MAQAYPRTLVIGVGNRSAGDDAVGLHILDRLRERPDLGCELRSCEGGCLPGFLAEIPADTLVIVVDAVDAGKDPGTLCCVKLPSQTIHARHLASPGAHGFHLEREIEEARKLHRAVPRLFLLGIQIGECQPGTALTAKVAAAAEEVVRDFSRYKKLAADMT